MVFMDWRRYDEIRDRWGSIRQWIYQGLREHEIATRLNVTVRELRKWRERKPDFDELWTGARQFIVGLLQEALIKEALGYESIEETTEKGKDLKGREVCKTKHVRRWHRGNVNAAIFIMCNLDNINYRRVDRDLVDHNPDNAVILDDITGAKDDQTE